jgi:hypothetical protein
MTKTRRRPHIQVPSRLSRTAEPYTPHGGGGSDKPSPPAIGRPAHAAALESSIESAVISAKHRKSAAGFSISGAKPGVYLEFESLPGWPLAVASMEKRRAKDPHRHIEVVAVSERTTSGGDGEDAEPAQHAVVFVPDGEVRHFLKQLEVYGRTTDKGRERRHENLFDRIADLRLATLQALWTDDPATYPAADDEPVWWEIWLRRTDGDELARLHEFATHADVRLSQHRIQFDARIDTLVRASARQLSTSLDVLNDLAELRRAKESATFFLQQDNRDQAGWAEELVARIQYLADEGPVICILDTGINSGHPLLEGSLAAADCHTINPNWGIHDHQGHGTQMAGLALYGDLSPLLEGSGPVVLSHGLESVKILPPKGTNDPDLYGAITAEATSRPEIEAPERRRVFSMAISSSDNREGGLPTSWSAAIDALAAGRSFDASVKGLVYLDGNSPSQQRLFVVCAGNVTPLEYGHLERSDTESVHDPAQAWNALTVGAYTEMAVITDPAWTGWSPLAPRGELSPWSTTSVMFEKQWPIKPDVVMEGGNVVCNDAGEVDLGCDDLNLLTTHHEPTKQFFVPTWATSAATALAARLCGAVAASYPELWPETIRGLIVHSAEWTPLMKANLDATSSKTRRARLVRRYGFGVPSLERALRSADSAVTLVVQDSIGPFIDGRMREIHVHELPWPRQVLESLGHVDVRLRVTLSYFVEPNPARRGWQSKYRYQSHGLQFEVKHAAESVGEFRKRLNKTALDEDEGRPRSGGSDEWYLGPQARNRGSLHADILRCSAADLADRGVIAVFPVTGWWKELKARDRSEHGARYALIVSIETERVDVDIWTPIATAVGIPVETTVG